MCRVIVPNGGETYHVGDSMTIQWQINPVPMSPPKKVAVFLAAGCDTCTVRMQIDLHGVGGLEPQVANSDPRYDANHIAT